MSLTLYDKNGNLDKAVIGDSVTTYEYDGFGKQKIADGNFVDDEPGNILYGHLGKAMGFDDEILKMAGGAVQVFQGRSNWKFASSYFDDPRDQKAIQKGIDLFRSTHSFIWW